MPTEGSDESATNVQQVSKIRRRNMRTIRAKDMRPELRLIGNGLGIFSPAALIRCPSGPTCYTRAAESWN